MSLLSIIGVAAFALFSTLAGVLAVRRREREEPDVIPFPTYRIHSQREFFRVINRD